MGDQGLAPVLVLDPDAAVALLHSWGRDETKEGNFRGSKAQEIERIGLTGTCVLTPRSYNSIRAGVGTLDDVADSAKRYSRNFGIGDDELEGGRQRATSFDSPPSLALSSYASLARDHQHLPGVNASTIRNLIWDGRV